MADDWWPQQVGDLCAKSPGLFFPNRRVEKNCRQLFWRGGLTRTYTCSAFHLQERRYSVSCSLTRVYAPFLLYFSFLFLSFFFVLWSVRKCVRTSVSAMVENVWFSMRSVCVFLCAELCFFLCPLCVPSEVCGHRVWKVWKSPVARYEATGLWRVICRRTIISQQQPIRHRLWT